MRTTARRGLVLSVAVLMLSSALVALGGDAASAQTTRSPGFVWSGAKAGIAPGGLLVYVKPSSRAHTKMMVTAARKAVAQQRKLRVPIRYAGLARTKPSSSRAVWVQDRPHGCHAIDGTVGLDSSTVESVEYTKAWVRFGGWIRMCRGSLTSMAQARTVLAHELGHAAGLGHYLRFYKHRLQIMYPGGPAQMNYQAGDRNGLRAVAAMSRKVAAAYASAPPVGQMGLLMPSPDGSIYANGFGYLPNSPSKHAVVTVYRDGVLVQKVPTSEPVTQVEKAQHLRAHPGFSFTVPGVAGTHVYVFKLLSPVNGVSIQLSRITVTGSAS